MKTHHPRQIFSGATERLTAPAARFNLMNGTYRIKKKRRYFFSRSLSFLILR